MSAHGSATQSTSCREKWLWSRRPEREASIHTVLNCDQLSHQGLVFNQFEVVLTLRWHQCILYISPFPSSWLLSRYRRNRWSSLAEGIQPGPIGYCPSPLFLQTNAKLSSCGQKENDVKIHYYYSQTVLVISILTARILQLKKMHFHWCGNKLNHSDWNQCSSLSVEKWKNNKLEWRDIFRICYLYNLVILYWVSFVRKNSPAFFNINTFSFFRNKLQWFIAIEVTAPT